MELKNQVQLITYPDSLGGDLQSLRTVLTNHFSDVFKGGVHILPPFPSSGDRGFAPLTYLEIDPSFGTWEDIKTIGEQFDILVDLMVNHISKSSEFFQDFLRNGMDSEYADLFITLDKLWKDGLPVKDDVNKIFLRRPKPYSTYDTDTKDGQVTVWTTFGKEEPSEQVDLDVKSERGKQLLTDFFVNFSKNNVKIVRLDAVGYVIKKMGTSCFFVEPEIYHFLDWIKEMADAAGITLLPEVHAHYETQYKLAERGFWIYDFILPYTVLHTLLNRSNKMLIDYLKVRPKKQFTMLDCHDGIPVLPDLEQLIDTSDARKVVDQCIERGALLSRIVSDDHKAPDGFDIHQICCTYYSALGQQDDAYIAARAIQLFTPGIPQIYYVGLLAGGNDPEAVKETGDNRAINRHNFTMSEIEQSLQKDVVQRLLTLIRFRNEYPAFQGEFHIHDSSEDEVRLSWHNGVSSCTLFIDLSTNQTIVEYTGDDGEPIHYRV